MKSAQYQWRTSDRAIVILLAVVCMIAAGASAQAPTDSGDTIRGTVVNSVTHEPIARALVYSPDNRFATLTNSEGRFEFSVPRGETPIQDNAGSNSSSAAARSQALGVGRPNALMARKPGFMPDLYNPGQNLPNENAKELTLALIPESLIVGTVTLPSSEALDSVTVQIFRRQVQDGHAWWVSASVAQSTSDGQFRFADLGAGTYKLLTHEQLDSDPLALDPLAIDPSTRAPREPLVGYPPVYYQNASDFESAATIQLAAGQTQTVNLTLAKRPYYQVKVPVISSRDNGMQVEVYSHGRKGPGFSLGYNNGDHAIEGWLPSGTYTIEASSFGANGLSGVQSITVRGAATDGPGMMLVPNVSIAVIVKEEFTSDDHSGTTTFNINGRNAVVKGPRRYLDVALEPTNDVGVGMGRSVSLRDPTGAANDALAIEGAPAGTYWVRVHSSRGYPASIRSGNLDLQHQPLIVGAGGGASPIEITMRDDVAEISGTVAGLTASPATAAQTSSIGEARGWTSYAPLGSQAAAHIYCVPLADSSGQFTDIWVNPDGGFAYPALAPGAYRLLAFDHEPLDFEYRNPEAVQAYDSKGTVVRLLAGQKERVQLQLISVSGMSEQ